jgi:predicted ATP-grasp superfamily ATP-dependent carboligase
VPVKVLLLDGYSTRSLACVRSWGKRNIAFAVGGETRCDMSLFSRYTTEAFVYTSPKRDASRFIRDINHYAHEFKADLVFPTSEAAIMACSRHRSQLSCQPLIPTTHEIETVFSKANTLRIAQSLGVTVPQTIHITDGRSRALESVALNFPVVLKSESSETMHDGRAVTSAKTFYAFNRVELENECHVRLARGESVLVQEFIDGYGVGVSGLFSKGVPVALLAHRRIRESNPTGGPSAVAETIELEPAILDPTTALFKRIGFTGPAMAEYRIRREDGKPYLMEVNGRFWGSVMLASAAGLDLPYLYWKMLNKAQITEAEKRYRIGIRGRNIVGDSKCLLLCLKGGHDRWPGQTVTRTSAVKSYVESFFDKRTHEMILTWEDPLPFLGRLIQPQS